MEIRHLNQKQLAERWQVSEASLERWRSEKLGPDYLKLHGRVLYRQQEALCRFQWKLTSQHT